MRVCNRYGFEQFFRRTEESDLPHRLGMRRLLTDEWDGRHAARRRRQSDVRKKAVRLLNRRIGCAWTRVQAELEALLRRECRNEAARLAARRDMLESVEPGADFRRPSSWWRIGADYEVDARGLLRRRTREASIPPTYLTADELRTEPEVIRNRK